MTTATKQQIVIAAGALWAAEIDLDDLIANTAWPTVQDLKCHDCVGGLVQESCKRIRKRIEDNKS